MGVEVQMSMREIRDYLAREVEKHQARIIKMLQNVGETVVNKIRTSDISEWNDQTGALRSSIGYIISLDGVPLMESNFERVDGPKRDATSVDGSQVGKSYAETLVSLYPKGIALIVVAGMEYASYVERMENKTVLAQGELEARRLVSQLIEQLNRAQKGE